MKLRVSDLRKIVREMLEMKLGVAGRFDAGRGWDDDDDAPSSIRYIVPTAGPLPGTPDAAAVEREMAKRRWMSKDADWDYEADKPIRGVAGVKANQPPPMWLRDEDVQSAPEDEETESALDTGIRKVR